MKKRILILSVLFTMLFIHIGCIHKGNTTSTSTITTTTTLTTTSTTINITQIRYECKEDKDCVPAQCCHPVSCINKRFAPNCKGIMCTMECRAGTMDCGYGRCVCNKNRCEVKWNK